jgi:hypothetical protein
MQGCHCYLGWSNPVKRISLDDAVDLIQKAVDYRGERWIDEQTLKGESCIYGHSPNEPSCIVGTAIFLLDPSAFAEIYGYEGVVEDNAFIESMAYTGYHIDSEAIEFFSTCQREQDRGAAWGDAQNAGLKLLDDED